MSKAKVEAGMTETYGLGVGSGSGSGSGCGSGAENNLNVIADGSGKSPSASLSQGTAPTSPKPTAPVLPSPGQTAGGRLSMSKLRSVENSMLPRLVLLDGSNFNTTLNGDASAAELGYAVRARCETASQQRRSSKAALASASVKTNNWSLN